MVIKLRLLQRMVSFTDLILYTGSRECLILQDLQESANRWLLPRKKWSILSHRCPRNLFWSWQMEDIWKWQEAIIIVFEMHLIYKDKRMAMLESMEIFAVLSFLFLFPRIYIYSRRLSVRVESAKCVFHPYQADSLYGWNLRNENFTRTQQAHRTGENCKMRIPPVQNRHIVRVKTTNWEFHPYTTDWSYGWKPQNMNFTRTKRTHCTGGIWEMRISPVLRWKIKRAK